jgi:hypothetical protein
MTENMRAMTISVAVKLMLIVATCGYLIELYRSALSTLLR